MKITNHLLSPCNMHLIPGGREMGIRRLLVIHFTAGASGASSIDWWEKLSNGVCAHLVIERDGRITQCRPFNRTAGHAGRSKWDDPNTGRHFTSVNKCSIGIELANGGCSYPLKFSDLASTKAKHKHGGASKEWETFPDAQLQACEAVSRLLVATYNLDDVVGHEDVSKGRKTDPGPAFTMAELRQSCGITSPLPK